MELLALQEINSQLDSIKGLLLIIGVLIFIQLVGAVLLIKAFMSLRSDGLIATRVFKTKAEDLADIGENEELKELAEERLSKYKNDKWALYYLGLSNFRLGNYPAAKAFFTKVCELDPSWDESVAGYIDEINEKIKLTPVQ